MRTASLCGIDEEEEEEEEEEEKEEEEEEEEEEEARVRLAPLVFFLRVKVSMPLL